MNKNIFYKIISFLSLTVLTFVFNACSEVETPSSIEVTEKSTDQELNDSVQEYEDFLSKLYNVLNDSTYLMQRNVKFEKISSEKCTPTYFEYRDAEGLTGQFNHDVVFSDGYKKEVSKTMTNSSNVDIFYTYLDNFLNQQEDHDFIGIYKVCTVDDTNYAIFENGDVSLSVSVWDKDGSFRFFLDEKGNRLKFRDNMKIYVTDEEFDQNVLVLLVNEAVPEVSWEAVLLDHDTFSSKTIEKCKLEFDLDEYTSDILFDSHRLECAPQYQ